MIAFIDWLSDDRHNADQIEAHLSRNQWMEHQVPAAMPADIDCIHDPSTGVSWVREGPVEHGIQYATGLHDVDDRTPDGFRGHLDQQHRDDLLAEPRYHEWFDQLNDGHPDHYPEPSLQASYLDGHLTDRGTFDAASPDGDIGRHVELDVAPHYAFGGDYHAVDVSNGADFSHVDASSGEANSGDCSAGDYVGGAGDDHAGLE